jgi:hypothetical protein
VTAWTSTDGLDWTDRGPAIGLDGLQVMTVVGGPAGALAATLRSGNQSGLWFSPDGVAWRSLSTPALSSTFWCSSGGYGGAEYVLLCPASAEATSADLPTQPMWSRNGVDWIAGTPPTTTGRPAGMDTVFAGSAGFIATGYIPGEAGPAQWWQSSDAATWQIDADYGPLGTFSSHAIPGGTYANGWLLGDGARLMALAFATTGSLSGKSWTSRDGASWTMLTNHGVPSAEQFDGVLFPSGVLAGDWWGAAS